MESLSVAYIVSAFLAGLLTFLAPCTFPLLPAYFSILKGEQEDVDAKTSQYIMFKNALYYVLGFSFVFITLGLLVGIIGSAIPAIRDLFRIFGGIVVILFGLYMLGLIRIRALNRSKKTTFDIKPGTKKGAFLLGFSMAFGWTPCVGPILASVLALASNTSTIFQGALLLFIFSAGLGLPFLLFALIADKAHSYVRKIAKYGWLTEKIAGILLILVGYMLLFDKMGIFMGYAFRLFSFIGYEKIVQYL